jgi:NADH-quinone oxidoreductase subunit K
MTPEHLILLTSAAVFVVGAGGVALRRNPVAMLMSVELMLNAAILALVLGARLHVAPTGQAAALLVLVLGAAEAVLGLALALAVFRTRERVDVDEAREVAG